MKIIFKLLGNGHEMQQIIQEIEVEAKNSFNADRDYKKSLVSAVKATKNQFLKTTEASGSKNTKLLVVFLDKDYSLPKKKSIPKELITILDRIIFQIIINGHAYNEESGNVTFLQDIGFKNQTYIVNKTDTPKQLLGKESPLSALGVRVKIKEDRLSPSDKYSVYIF